MAYSHYNRFTRTQRRIAIKSDGLPLIQLVKLLELKQIVEELKHQLTLENLQFVERSSQHLVDAVCQQLEFSSARVHVLERRPYDDMSELHGLYEPVDEARPRARIYVWMRTAKRQQVVAFKTYLRTLVHELCHHLDYEYYELEDSLHTQGFFQRESNIMKQLFE
ncbi:MAG: hypothetical protein R8G33_07295 [Gammaproteobacteria bacterium]|nr:hypothetical protein [Gammaproteobacteria bacterium]